MYHAAVFLTALTLSAAPGVPCAPIASRPVDIAICLDTSNSMDGLIDSAKEKLWAIVNEMAKARPTPDLRVGLISYGNDGYDSSGGWVRLESELTSNLDFLSQRLFGLTTLGGTEYVGRALLRANQLDWSQRKDALRMIIVAGNESADQDHEITASTMSRDLRLRGIFVDAIYCGSAEDAISPTWRSLAACGGGEFASIDQNDGTVVVRTPYDSELNQLSRKLSNTFVPLGHKGARAKRMQSDQDTEVRDMSPTAGAGRAAAKASKLYRWEADLVDATERGEMTVAEVPEASLPSELQGMTKDERQLYIDSKVKERKDLREQIEELSQRRDEHVAQEMKAQNLSESAALDSAIRKSIRDKARGAGFAFDDES